MDSLADDALGALTREVETDSRKRPAEWHARPYSDLPMIFHGRTFLEMRPRLAHALFLTDAYREWTIERLQAEAQADLEALEERLRRRAPQYSDAAVHAAARELLATGTLSDDGFESAEAALGYHRLVDLVGAIGHFCTTAMTANVVGAKPAADAPSHLKS